MAEQILPALLNDAAHSLEVLSLRTSLRLSERACSVTSCSTVSHLAAMPVLITDSVLALHFSDRRGFRFQLQDVDNYD